MNKTDRFEKVGADDFRATHEGCEWRVWLEAGLWYIGIAIGATRTPALGQWRRFKTRGAQPRIYTARTAKAAIAEAERRMNLGVDVYPDPEERAERAEAAKAQRIRQLAIDDAEYDLRQATARALNALDAWCEGTIAEGGKGGLMEYAKARREAQARLSALKETP